METKWVFISIAVMMIAVFGSVGAIGWAEQKADAQKYSACVKYHSPKECE